MSYPPLPKVGPIGFASVADVTILHPAPEPHHPECAEGCSAGGRSLAGPCRHECAKTPEFQERCERDAEASRLRFRTQVGANVLRAVPAASAADGVGGTDGGTNQTGA